MAIIQTGAVVSAISGRMDGVVFARGRGGPYVRTFVPPTQPRTDPQQENRALFGQMSVEWGALDESERSAFSSAALSYPRTNSLGVTYYMSGQQFFISLNQSLQKAYALVGLDTPAILTTPPAGGTTLPIEDLENVSGGIAFDYGAVDDIAIIASSPPLTPGRSFVQNYTDVVGAQTLNGANTFSSLISDLQTFWGAQAVGTVYRLMVRVVQATNGLQTTQYPISVVVPA